MKTNNAQNSNIIADAVARYIADTIISSMAVRYDSLANRVFSRRAYRIESEMAAIASEVASHARIPSEQVERFLVALAKAKRPAVELSLPTVAGLERREIAEYRPGLTPIPAARKVAVMADWSPSRNVEVAL